MVIESSTKVLEALVPSIYIYIYWEGKCRSNENIDISCREIRIILLHEFRLGHKATEAANNICSTMGPGVLSIRTAQHWFDRFRNGNYELDDQPRSGRPIGVATPRMDMHAKKVMLSV